MQTMTPRLACAVVMGLLVNSIVVGQDAGAIVGWGEQVVMPPSKLTDLVGVAGGGAHSLGQKGDGSIVAWGDNYYGGCNVPAPNSGFVAVAGGGDHSLGLKAGGSIVAWG